MSADAAASQAAPHEPPIPQDSVFTWRDIDPSTFTTQTFKAFQDKVSEAPENVQAWFHWISDTVKYKNHLINKTIGQQAYLNTILEHDKELTDNYTAADEKCTVLMMELVETKKGLAAARKELAQTKLELVDEQSKNSGNPVSSSSATPATPTTSNQSVMSEKNQRSAKLPDAPEYKGDRESLEP